jgi:hypothetical protein
VRFSISKGILEDGYGVRFISLFLVLFTSSVCSAFINVESVRQRDGEGFFGNSSLKASGQRGNTNKLTLNASTIDIQRGQRDEVLMLLDYNYGSSENIKDTNNAQAHARYVFFSREPSAYEIFAQYEFDQFKDLNSREIAGANLRRRLFRDELTSIFGAAGAFYEIEDYTSVAHRNGARGNFYLSYARKLEDRLTTSTTVYYQPLFRRAGDYRIRAQADLDVHLTHSLRLNIEYVLSHDSWVPTPNIVKTDMNWLFGLSLAY